MRDDYKDQDKNKVVQLPYAGDEPQDDGGKKRQEQAQTEKLGIRQILEADLNNQNIAELISDEELGVIACNAIEGYEYDLSTMQEWIDFHEKPLGYAVAKTSRVPKIPGGHNVVFPLLTEGIMQFVSRASSRIFDDERVVEYRPVGTDAVVDADPEILNRCERKTDYLNHLLLKIMEGWEDGLDKLLAVYANCGIAWKKTYWNPAKDDPASEYVHPFDVIYDHNAPSFSRLLRISHRFKLSDNEITERIRAEVFLNTEIAAAQKTDEESSADTPSNYQDDYFDMVEQHCWLDLDQDGYKEPYIVTVAVDSAKVVRIKPRFTLGDMTITGDEKDENPVIVSIKPENHFTPFQFLPALDGKLTGCGLGTLLNGIQEAINSGINSLLDAAAQQNIGFNAVTKQFRSQNQDLTLTFSPHFQTVELPTGEKLSDHILSIRNSGPSAVLFELLGWLKAEGDKVASSTDIMQGAQPARNETATTTMARVEQGMEMFKSVLMRLFRALGEESKKIDALLVKHKEFNGPAYFGTNGQFVQPEDFDKNVADTVQPVGDPNNVSDLQEQARANSLIDLIPIGLNPNVVRQRVLKSRKIKNPEEFEAQENQPPDPNVQAEMMKLEIEKAKIELQQAEIEIKRMLAQAEIENKRADTIKKIAEAEAKEAGQQMEYYRAQTDRIVADLQEQIAERDALLDQTINAGEQENAQPNTAGQDSANNLERMEGTPGDAGVLPSPEQGVTSGQLALSR